ncbi:subtilisin-like protein [Acaromyces ingoldii]|uniref:tripeptidyl-peptidase II n=1 Tax=Acaromyces ingoldii TaxID=215250 RepID=A0A316YK45_9BASI|nr:subtilisin-like protein [Acaromyces ingoldii]PWN89446.1 subtilisin-like protein [Acaromyces ingoldii]
MQFAIALATLVAAVGALPSNMVIKESVHAPEQWVRKSTAPDDVVLPLRIGLKHKRGEELEEKLLDIAHPDSASYGQWLSREEVNSYLEPEEGAADAVRRWLADHGVQEDHQKRSVAGDWLHAAMTVKQARALLGDADFAVWEHRETGRQLIRTTEYAVPRSLNGHIDLISGTTYFGQGLDRLKGIAEAESEPADGRVRIANVNSVDTNGVPAECHVNATTILCLREYYKTVDYKVKKAQGQSVAISGFLEQYAIKSDFKQFLSTERPDAAKAGYDFNIVSIDGGINNQSLPGSEANLDVQAFGGVAYNIPVTFYDVAGRPPFKADKNTPTNTNEPYSSEFEYLLQKKKVPSIVSTSYGDDEQTVPLAYQKRVCREIAALGARGTTMLFASGDYGVGNDGTCFSNDGKNTPKFLPSFPASCPYSVTVGATIAFNPERAVDTFYSGGGFSDVWPTPKYQKDTVDAYVASLGDKFKGLYNPKGRAYPDLAAQGSRFVIVIGGRYSLISGTSASTPLVAGILALVNDERLAKGKSTLGFINPALYSGKGEKGLKDITIGSAKGCNTTGFPAQKGWDPVTGFGTPVFDKLSSVFV